DLTPLDFFLWAAIKEYVYSEPVNNIQELNDRITEAVATITPEMIQRSRQSLIQRAQLCIEVGGQFEHLL
ncbi:hypothetical protein EAG_14319, partial [Camponotus floridanus]